MHRSLEKCVNVVKNASKLLKLRQSQMYQRHQKSIKVMKNMPRHQTCVKVMKQQIHRMLAKLGATETGRHAWSPP
jgi:hypothetical protein